MRNARIVAATILLICAAPLAANTPAKQILRRGEIPPPIFPAERWDGVTPRTPVAQDDGLREGGDTCETATVIGGLPYSDEGATWSASDDYDEPCPWDSTSPDVVYVYTPTTDQVVNITLCNGTWYDSKLYVYENECGETGDLLPAYACNDDACDTVSAITELSLTGGNTYYIVVDGWGGQSGSYRLDMYEWHPTPECPDGTMTGQSVSNPDEQWNLAVADSDVNEDGGVERWESFRGALGPICGLRWYGISAEYTGWSFDPCSESPMNFAVTFHEDVNGAPGQEVASFDVVIPPTPTGVYYSIYELLQFDVDFSSTGCIELENGWVSIQGGGDDASCWFLWASSGNEGDDGAKHWRDVNDGWGLMGEKINLAMCLSGTIADGACCNSDDGSCEDTPPTSYQDCMGEGDNMRFAPNGTCADFTPDCGVIWGACCDMGGACSEGTESDCLAAGGIYRGDYSTCMSTFCPQEGDVCELPITVYLPDDLEPEFNEEYTLCGAWQDYDDTCLGYSDDGEDVIYELVVNDDVCLDINLSSNENGMAMAIDDTCPLDSGDDDCLYKNTDYWGPWQMEAVRLPVGVYYLMLDRSLDPECSDYDLTIAPCRQGACCTDEGCQMLAPSECDDADGIYMGDDTDCDSEPCSFGACCGFDGSCQEIDEEACDLAGGIYHGGGTRCTEDECPQPCECPETITTYPYDEDFENGFGLWENSGDDDFDWDENSGSTPSGSTGPDEDHTLGNQDGHYLYTEASNDNNPEKTAILVGPCFDLTGLATPELAFWYHMNGYSMGTLYVEVSTDSCITWDEVFSQQGDQGYDWELAMVDLSDYAGQTIHLRFRGETGDDYASDMAIDDLHLGEPIDYPGGCCDIDTGDCLGMITESECAASGNTTWHIVEDCSEDNFCPQPPPANDQCEDAIEIDALPFVDTDVVLTWATPDIKVSCNDDDACPDETGFGVWYHYTATEDCGARIDLDTHGFWAQTVTGIFEGDDCGNLTEIECTDSKEHTYDLAGGSDYWILVASWHCEYSPGMPMDVHFDCVEGACCLGDTCVVATPSECDDLEGFYVGDDAECTPDVCLSGACCNGNGCEVLTPEECEASNGEFHEHGMACELELCPPVNEACVEAIEITDGDPSVEGSNHYASEDDDAEASCVVFTDRDLWYSYTATCTGTVVADLAGSADFDTVLSAWDECGGHEIACDDDSSTNDLSRLEFEAAQGRTYWLRMASDGSYGDVFRIAVSCTEAPQGACCTGDACTIGYQIICEEDGGIYAGDGTICAGDDCNINGAEDVCEVLWGTAPDCNDNRVPDSCDVAAGTSTDYDANANPDECDDDCNSNGIIDGCDITCAGDCALVANCGGSGDCQGDDIPDDCQLDEKTFFDNGEANEVDGTRPDVGWTDAGMADDFTLDDAIVGHRLRLDIYDDNGTDDFETMRVRVYEAPDGLMNLGSFGEATPVFDATYSRGSGDLEIIDTGVDFYYLRLYRFEASGQPFFLDPGHYALHIMFPGTAGAGFWATAGENDSDCAIVWGPQVDSPADACEGGPNMTVLSFALLSAETNDCNENGVPDACDIAPEYGGLCDPQVSSCITDYNANFLPDNCDFCGDLDTNGAVDYADFQMFLASYATCEGDDGYMWDSDYNGDGCVTLADYQHWLVCYKMVNGRAFRVPSAPGNKQPTRPVISQPEAVDNVPTIGRPTLQGDQ